MVSGLKCQCYISFIALCAVVMAKFDKVVQDDEHDELSEGTILKAT